MAAWDNRDVAMYKLTSLLFFDWRAMLDIPELQKFDVAINAHSWLDEVSGDLMAWSRGEYDDYRRKHQNCGLATSTEILKYFELPCNRVGWQQLMSRRFNLSVPGPSEGCFYATGGTKARNAHYEDMKIVGWEEAVHLIVDEKLDGTAMEELINAMSARPVFS
jgi:hypothetical protein